MKTPTQNPVQLLRETVEGLSANVQVLMNVIKDPDGGSEMAKWMILRVAENTVENAKEAIAATENAGWCFDMEKAPRDGTRILVMNGVEGGYHTKPHDIGVAEWSTSSGRHQWCSIACCDGVSYYLPIAWQHLPTPPTKSEG